MPGAGVGTSGAPTGPPRPDESRMIALLRRGVLGAADALGVNRGLARSKWRNQRLLILCYHGFALGDEHRWDPQLVISPQTFRRRLGWLPGQRLHRAPPGRGAH